MIINPNKFSTTKIATRDKFAKLTRKMTFKDCEKISENIFEVKLDPSQILEKYPLHIGNTVLHLSKLIMLEFVTFLEEYLLPDTFRLIYTGKLF